MQCEGLLEVSRRRVIIRDFDNLNEVADMQPAIGHQAD
jgi:hypothetical protein